MPDFDFGTVRSQAIEWNQRPATPRIALDADYDKRAVLSADVWSYVDLWLTREGADEALLYWMQARKFLQAADGKDPLTSPLLYYYSFLNSAKALLATKGVLHSPYHGLGQILPSQQRTVLDNERVAIAAAGVFQDLFHYYAGRHLAHQTAAGHRAEHSVKNLLRNVIVVHAAYNSTFQTHAPLPLFEPLHNPWFLQTAAGDVRLEAGVFARGLEQLSLREQNRRISSLLDGQYESFPAGPDGLLICSTMALGQDASAAGLATANRAIHARLHSIVTPHEQRFYLRRNRQGALDWPQAATMFAAMFHFGSRVRYHPSAMSTLLEGQQNWLIGEFLQAAPDQFTALMASEITGCNFQRPYAGLP
jgi:hypothetical protein